MTVLSKSRQLHNVSTRSLRLLFQRHQGQSGLSGSLLPKRGSRTYFNLGGDVPSDPQGQAKFLRDLNRRNDPEAVIRFYESGAVAQSEAALSEYVKALARVDRLDGSALLSVLQRGASATGYAAAPAAPSFAARGLGSAAGMGGAAGMGMGAGPMGGAPMGSGVGAAPLGMLGLASDLGTARNPIVMTQAEPSFKTQLWRSMRMLAVAFLLISGAGALFEDRGLARGILNNPDMRPQIETTTKFADVKGVDEAKGELEEIVQYLRDPRKFTALGGKLPKGVLLVGPPGTGKTMLARAIAGEAGVPFFYCSGSEFEEMFVGVGARRVRDLFSAAKKASPCIVFIDEIDAIGGSRNPKDQMYMKMTLNQLLVELDGFKPSEGVIVVAATNFPESLDKALVRPGRFDRHVVVPTPDVKGRKQILEVHFKNIPREQNVDLTVIARGTPGFSGADLANLVNIAALKAARDGRPAVDMHALEYAKDRIVMGAERKSAVISERNRRNTAYHEGGHALVAIYSDGAEPVHKATIMPRGMALGMVYQLPEEDQLNYTKRQLLARLAVAMGGKAAEELIFGEQEVTTGASEDLTSATKLARAMVTRFGMSDKVGHVSLNYSNTSEDTRELVDEEVKAMLATAYNTARSILKSHEAELHALAKELLDKETLTGQQIMELLKKQSPSTSKQ